MFKLELFVKFWKELRKLSFEFVEFREDLRFDEFFDKKELVVRFWFKEVFIEVLCLFVLVGWNFCSCLDFLGVLLLCFLEFIEIGFVINGGFNVEL